MLVEEKIYKRVCKFQSQKIRLLKEELAATAKKNKFLKLEVDKLKKEINHAPTKDKFDQPPVTCSFDCGCGHTYDSGPDYIQL